MFDGSASVRLVSLAEFALLIAIPTGPPRQSKYPLVACDVPPPDAPNRLSPHPALHEPQWVGKSPPVLGPRGGDEGASKPISDDRNRGRIEKCDPVLLRQPPISGVALLKPAPPDVGSFPSHPPTHSFPRVVE